jgi:hypothetical protein
MLVLLLVSPALTSFLQFKRVLEDMTEVALGLVARGSDGHGRCQYGRRVECRGRGTALPCRRRGLAPLD